MLHLTNGDAAADLLRAAGFTEPILPWRDVLHEGPVPTGLNNAALDDVRARFLAGKGWGDFETIHSGFLNRRLLLEEHRGRDEIVLWFEHDLYDQLQLLQILHDCAYDGHGEEGLSLLCLGSFPGVDPFEGLGQLSPGDFRTLFPARAPVTPAQLDLGRIAWHAFRDPDPSALTEYLASDTSPMPFLSDAIRRHLQQYPAVGTGLGRTERVTLEALRDGELQAGALFRQQHEQEERPFLGDLTYWDYLRRLSSGPHPLIGLETPVGNPFRASRCRLTDAGRRVLYGSVDHVRLNGLDRWLGGVHLRGTTCPWRWDEEEGILLLMDVRNRGTWLP